MLQGSFEDFDAAGQADVACTSEKRRGNGNDCLLGDSLKALRCRSQGFWKCRLSRFI